ncbi:MAG: N-acetyltransferase, partial [Saprospiraceae bacterium]|nr:N-acetyltransferase [Saprospiraceae bacterium]
QQTAITFEYETPSLTEMENRMTYTQAKYPYLVAEVDQRIVGYAYASDFRTRAAYQWSPESTIYLHPLYYGKGIGKMLYQKLFELLALQGYYNVFAGVALPNEASVALHQKLGFREIGVYENIGYKFGKWHTTKWFQLVLKTHEENPARPQTPENIEWAI